MSGDARAPPSRTTDTTSAGDTAARLFFVKASSAESSTESATPTTLGMTSPARSTSTRLPTARCSFFRSRSWKLCSVARLTEAPPSSAGGRSTATGVSAPVRPTCTSMAASVVTAVAAWNLCAVAHRGARASAPSRAL